MKPQQIILLLWVGVLIPRLSMAAEACVGSLRDFFRNPMAPLCRQGSKEEQAPDKLTADPGADPSSEAEGKALIQGKVLSTLDTGGYTYIEIDTGVKRLWAATRPKGIKVGSHVAFKAKSPHENFYSPSLKKTFPQLYLVDELSVDGSNSVSESQAKEATDKAAKGSSKDTLAYLIAHRQSFKGKKLAVKGKVIKVNSHIMGVNWVHIVDASLDQAESFPLTTAQEVTVGDTVSAEGIVTIDKDLGSGYFFPVLLEKAEVLTVAAKR